MDVCSGGALSPCAFKGWAGRGSLALWGVGGGLWAGPQKALSFSTSRHWACTLVLCVPISGLLSASPQCQDLGQLHLETLSGEGRPPWDPSPPEMEQLQKLGSSVLEVPLVSQEALGGGAEMSPGTRPRCPHRSGTLG